MAFIIGPMTPLHAKKIGCQFEQIRKNIDVLAENSARTWKAIRNLDKKVTDQEKKIFKRNRTYIYQNYQNPYYANVGMSNIKKDDDDDDNAVLVIGSDDQE